MVPEARGSVASGCEKALKFGHPSLPTPSCCRNSLAQCKDVLTSDIRAQSWCTKKPGMRGVLPGVLLEHMCELIHVQRHTHKGPLSYGNSVPWHRLDWVYHTHTELLRRVILLNIKELIYSTDSQGSITNIGKYRLKRNKLLRLRGFKERIFP